MKKFLSAALVLAGATLPAAAQTIYLPLVQNQTLGANQVRTRIQVTNTSDADRRFSTLFLAAGTDGSTARDVLPKVGVVPQGTTIAATSGNIGLLEVTGAPQLRYLGLLEVVNGQGQLVGTASMPLIGSDNLIAKSASITLQGLQKSATRTSSVGVANLAKEAAQCQLTFRQASGAQIGSNVLITVQPLSLRFFPDALGTLGQTAIADARVVVSCDNTFYPYVVTLGTDGSNPLFAGPSTSGASKLTPPGVEPPPPPGVVILERSGTFLNAIPGDSTAEFALPVVFGKNYKKVEADFDFFLDRFNTDLFHTISSLRMNGVIWTLIVRADRLRTIIDTNAGSTGQAADWVLKRTYHIHAVADATTNELLMEIKRGNEDIQITRQPLGRTFFGTFVERLPLRIDFSQDKVRENGAYVPLWGSRFSNLRVVVTPFEENASIAPAFATEGLVTDGVENSGTLDEPIFQWVPSAPEQN